MNLFLETPQQAAERARRESRARGSSDSDGDLGSRLFDGCAFESEPAVERALERASAAGRSSEPDPATESAYATEAPVSRAAEAAFAPVHDSYEAELAFARRRSQRRVLGRILRSIGLAVALPLLLALIFFASYTVTLILNGASPQEVMEQLHALVAHIEEVARTILPVG